MGPLPHGGVAAYSRDQHASLLETVGPPASASSFFETFFFCSSVSWRTWVRHSVFRSAAMPELFQDARFISGIIRVCLREPPSLLQGQCATFVDITTHGRSCGRSIVALQ